MMSLMAMCLMPYLANAYAAYWPMPIKWLESCAKAAVCLPDPAPVMNTTPFTRLVILSDLKNDGLDVNELAQIPKFGFVSSMSQNATPVSAFLVFPVPMDIQLWSFSTCPDIDLDIDETRLSSYCTWKVQTSDKLFRERTLYEPVVIYHVSNLHVYNI